MVNDQGVTQQLHKPTLKPKSCFEALKWRDSLEQRPDCLHHLMGNKPLLVCGAEDSLPETVGEMKGKCLCLARLTFPHTVNGAFCSGKSAQPIQCDRPTGGKQRAR